MKSAFKKKRDGGRISIYGLNRVLALLVVSVLIQSLLGACVLHTPSRAPVLHRPETKLFDFQSSVVLSALQQVFADKNFTVNARRSNRQCLETEWLQDGSYRSMVIATVSELGKYRSRLTLHLLIQKKSFLQKSWQPVDEIDKTVYDDLMNNVLMESYRVLYDRR